MVVKYNTQGHEAATTKAALMKSPTTGRGSQWAVWYHWKGKTHTCTDSRDGREYGESAGLARLLGAEANNKCNCGRKIHRGA